MRASAPKFSTFFQGLFQTFKDCGVTLQLSFLTTWKMYHLGFFLGRKWPLEQKFCKKNYTTLISIKNTTNFVLTTFPYNDFFLTVLLIWFHQIWLTSPLFFCNKWGYWKDFPWTNILGFPKKWNDEKDSCNVTPQSLKVWKWPLEQKLKKTIPR